MYKKLFESWKRPTCIVTTCMPRLLQVKGVKDAEENLKMAIMHLGIASKSHDWLAKNGEELALSSGTGNTTDGVSQVGFTEGIRTGAGHIILLWARNT